MTGRTRSAIGAVASIAAAGFRPWASLVPISDSLDTFTAALQLSSKLNAIAAICAAIASLCAAYGFLKSAV